MSDALVSRATFYDITGYLIPGILAIWIAWVSWYAFCDVHNAVAATHRLCDSGFVSALGFLSTGYVVGHLVNALSSWLLEKHLLKARFVRARDWIGRLDPSRKAAMEMRVKRLFEVDVSKLTSFDMRIRCEERLPHSFVTGFSFLSFYGMCRTLALLTMVAMPVVVKLVIMYIGTYPLEDTYLIWVKLGCGIGALAICCLVSLAFVYQYLRFVVYYYDYLGSTLMCDAE